MEVINVHEVHPKVREQKVSFVRRQFIDKEIQNNFDLSHHGIRSGRK